MASMSPTGSELAISSNPLLRAYQEALRTPGISALFASMRKQRRQILNLRWYPRRRPQIEQRLYAREGNFGFFFCLTFQRMLAIPEQSSLVLAERDPEQLQELEGVPRPAGLHADRDVHALGEFQLLDVYLGEHDLFRDAHVVVPRLIERPGR